MKLYLGEWVVPVAAPPVRGGAVVVEGGEIVAVGAREEILALYGDRVGVTSIVDLGDAVIVPAFVNAHTHLELSWMERDPPPKHDLMAWVRAMIARATPPPETVAHAARAAMTRMREAGTCLVGDVGNSLAALPSLRASGLGGAFFLEMLGGWDDRAEEMLAAAESDLNEAMKRPPLATAECDLDDAKERDPQKATGHDHHARERHPREAMDSRFDGTKNGPRSSEPPWSSDRLHGLQKSVPSARISSEQLSASISPHSAMAVAPDLLRAIATHAKRSGSFVSVHVAESRAEVELLTHGAGPFRALMDERAGLSAEWRPPGLTPVQVLDEAGLLGPRMLAAHAIHVTAEDVRLLRSREATIVLCPRSNAWIGVGEAPVDLFVREDVRVALGTDSLASNDDLDMLSELASLRALAPHTPAPWALRAATLGGAQALGLGAEWGSIEPGKRAALLALSRRSISSGSRSGIRQQEPRSSTQPALDPTQDPEPYATIYAGPDKVHVRVLS